jgi:hypothetical protein
LFLFYFYQQKGSENVLFKGGTALKIIYQNPRFSEDLDFSAENFKTKKRIEDLFINTLAKISKENIPIELREAKFTAGGYLGILFYKIYGFENEMFFEVSFRKKKLKKEITTIISEYLPPYIVVTTFTRRNCKRKNKCPFGKRKATRLLRFLFYFETSCFKKIFKKERFIGSKRKSPKERNQCEKRTKCVITRDSSSSFKKFQEKPPF